MTYIKLMELARDKGFQGRVQMAMFAVAKDKVDGLTNRLGMLEQEHVDVLKKYDVEEGQARDRVTVIQSELAALEKRLRG